MYCNKNKKKKKKRKNTAGPSAGRGEVLSTYGVSVK